MLNIVTGADLAADGVYGEATVAAVDAFQRFVGLQATGEADHETRMLLRYIDGGRSLVLPTWPLPTIGDGGANGCQVAVIGDSLMAGTQQLHADRLAEIGCVSAVDGVGGRSTAFGWQCRVLQANGRRPLLLLAEPEPGNDTCAPSGLELLRMWSEARALGDVVVLALGTNDATLFNDQHWGAHWEQVFEFAGNRPVIVVTTQARPGHSAALAQAEYSEALRQWCASAQRCVLADWARTDAANDAGSYVDAVHLTRAGTDARASFIRDVVRALLTGQPIPNPVALATPTTTVLPTTTSTITTVPPSTTTVTTTIAPATTTTSTATATATSTATATATATTTATVPATTVPLGTTSTTSTTEPPVGG
jgi:peptidoglycan hydrolase-like protein with peptidoglycan-binding domain